MIPRRFLPVFLLMFAFGPVSTRSQTQTSDSPKTAASSDSPIHFAFQPIDFKLDSNETPERHAPETMAGGVAVFDYNNDGKLDIFFTNGADIKTLQKDFREILQPPLRERRRRTLHRRDRKSRACSGPDTTPAWPSATTTTTDTTTFLSPASIATRSITTTATGPSRMSPPKPA